MKVYAALLISSEPIDIGPETAKGELRHCVVKELALESNGHGGFIIQQAAPEFCDGQNTSFVGSGPCVSVAVTGWLKDLCGSMSYQPLWRKKP